MRNERHRRERLTLHSKNLITKLFSISPQHQKTFRRLEIQTSQLSKLTYPNNGDGISRNLIELFSSIFPGFEIQETVIQLELKLFLSVRLT